MTFLYYSKYCTYFTLIIVHVSFIYQLKNIILNLPQTHTYYIDQTTVQLWHSCTTVLSHITYCDYFCFSWNNWDILIDLYMIVCMLIFLMPGSWFLKSSYAMVIAQECRLSRNPRQKQGKKEKKRKMAMAVYLVNPVKD